MKRFTTILVGTTLLAGTAAAVVPVLADGHGGPGGCRHEFGQIVHGGFGISDMSIEHLATRLDLSKDQLASVRGIADKERPQVRKLLDEITANHDKLRALRGQESPDEAQLRGTADAQGKAIADMIVLRAHVRVEIDKVLTADQRKKLHHMDRGWGRHMERDAL